MIKNILKLNLYALFLFLTTFYIGCSELKDDIDDNPSKLYIHEEGIIDPTSDDFHGKLLKDGKWMLSECQKCHGADYSGGPKAVSCRSCHQNAGGHKEGISNPVSPDFHGKLLKEGTWKFADCKVCHGTDLKGGPNTPSCSKCHANAGGHLTGIIEPTSPNFHGKLLKEGTWKYIDCQACHGSDLKGGEGAPSCSKCHSNAGDHKAGIVDPNSENFHGKLLKEGNWKLLNCQPCHGTNLEGAPNIPSCRSCHSNAGAHKTGVTDPTSPNFHGKIVKAGNWNMSPCQNCHGSNLQGGPNSPSCSNCHTNSGGPTACNTCHGNFSNSSRIAPPRDINGNTSTTSVGVGAHANHLYDNKLGNKVTCVTCHTVPSSYASHNINGTAAINFSGLAGQGGADSKYNTSSNTCSNTYCHGNFEFKKSDAAPENQYAFTGEKMTGNNKTVTWNKVGQSEAFCGSCHGLPPIGHIQVPANQCVACHSTVVGENGQIKDITKHINGIINVGLKKK